MMDWLKQVLRRVMPWVGADARLWQQHLDDLVALPLDQAEAAAMSLLVQGKTFRAEPRADKTTAPQIPEACVRALLERYDTVWNGDATLGGEVREVEAGYWLFGYEYGGEVRLLVRNHDSWVYTDDGLDANGPRKLMPSVYHYILGQAYFLDDVPLPVPSRRVGK